MKLFFIVHKYFSGCQRRRCCWFPIKYPNWKANLALRYWLTTDGDNFEHTPEDLVEIQIAGTGMIIMEMMMSSLECHFISRTGLTLNKKSNEPICGGEKEKKNRNGSSDID